VGFKRARLRFLHASGIETQNTDDHTGDHAQHLHGTRQQLQTGSSFNHSASVTCTPFSPTAVSSVANVLPSVAARDPGGAAFLLCVYHPVAPRFQFAL